ncbi:MAG: hypothetical protein IKZ13_09830 [Akkermansia sp.]|nr:hypothetical protein [Akkermansia sp.]
MKEKLTNAFLATAFTFAFSSCEVMLNDFINFNTAPINVQTGTNAAQTGFTNSVQWQSGSYDSNGIPIYGYADGRPVYGYTKQGSLIYQVNHLYSGCYVPSWGSSAYHPQGVIRTRNSPL